MVIGDTTRVAKIGMISTRPIAFLKAKEVGKNAESVVIPLQQIALTNRCYMGRVEVVWSAEK